MRLRRSEVWFFAAATGMHVVALGVLRLAFGDGAPRAPVSSPTRPDISFDIDFDDVSETATRGEVSDGREAVSSRGARFVARPGVPEPHGDGVDAEVGEPTDSAEATLDLAPGEGEANAPIDLGLGPDGWQRWMTAPKSGEQRADRRVPANKFQLFRAPPVSTTGGLQEGLEERDRALGLGPQGRVMSALHNAAHKSEAPQLGSARFDVTVHRTGAVEVTLRAASGEFEKWKKVAGHVASDLRAAPPKIPPPRDGMKLVVELVAEETMPDGRKVKALEPRHLEVTPPKFESGERAIERLAEDNPAMKDPSPDIAPTKLDMPGVYLAERGKVCSNRIGAAVAGHGPRLPLTVGPMLQGSCEPSNIGAAPQRMVRARVLEQTVF